MTEHARPMALTAEDRRVAAALATALVREIRAELNAIDVSDAPAASANTDDSEADPLPQARESRPC